MTETTIDSREERARLRAAYVRVLISQAAALLLLWALQSAFTR